MNLVEVWGWKKMKKLGIWNDQFTQSYYKSDVPDHVTSTHITFRNLDK